MQGNAMTKYLQSVATRMEPTKNNMNKHVNQLETNVVSNSKKNVDMTNNININ